MERGAFHLPEVQELFKQYTLLEVFTDRAWEREHYGALQKEIAGTTALPTYIVLDSEHQLEVTRSYYTHNDDDFIRFLQKGLDNKPGFYSLVRFSNLNGVELDGTLESHPGERVVYQDADRFAYSDRFWATQELYLPETLQPGKYVLRAELITALYRGDERGAVLSIPMKLEFEVIEES